MTEPHAPAHPEGVDENYQYWREHGGAWVNEYTTRKKFQILYHIEELMLADYARGTARFRERPLRVLEFGCGVGRHLRNLNAIENVEVHGYDQSEAMARGVRTWAEPGWFEDRVRVGMPTGPLPYPDGSFDLVYSAEVLVHVRPEHLKTVLSEIVRVCRGHVVHLEPSPHVKVASGAHHGCWNHDLRAAYSALGLACEALGRGYDAHTPYRTIVAEPASYTWSEGILAMYRAMERDIDEGFNAMRADAANAWTQRERLADASEQQRATIDTQSRELSAVLADRDGLLAQLSAMQERLDGAVSRGDELASRLESHLRESARAQAELKGDAASWRGRAEELGASLARTRSDAAALKHLIDGFVAGADAHLKR